MPLRREGVLPKNVYLDHAATTHLDAEALAHMLPYLQERYGNPSSLYPAGSVVKSELEGARRTMKGLLGGSDGNLFFTSGGTEANNWAIHGVVEGCGVKHIITSPLEHASVLEPVRAWQKKGVEVSYVGLKAGGEIDYGSLERLLERHPRSLVSLMHGNNEVGNLTDVGCVAALCRQYAAIFHSDLVQTVGYYPIDLTAWGVDVCTGSAHKFYGPKGVGFLYVREGLRLAPLLYGGQQERGLRGGTENVAGIVGMAYALEKQQGRQEKVREHIGRLKQYMIEQLEETIPDITFHGLCKEPTKSLCTIVNVGLPQGDPETLIMQLALEGVATSSGSACMSGGKTTSHVLKALGVPATAANVRLSLGVDNDYEDIDHTVAALQKIL
ncbi:MAG: cysteine desulfurase family protein [Bacteroidota bacterium]